MFYGKTFTLYKSDFLPTVFTYYYIYEECQSQPDEKIKASVSYLKYWVRIAIVIYAVSRIWMAISLNYRYYDYHQEILKRDKKRGFGSFRIFGADCKVVPGGHQFPKSRGHEENS